MFVLKTRNRFGSGKDIPYERLISIRSTWQGDMIEVDLLNIHNRYERIYISRDYTISFEDTADRWTAQIDSQNKNCYNVYLDGIYQANIGADSEELAIALAIQEAENV